MTREYRQWKSGTRVVLPGFRLVSPRGPGYPCLFCGSISWQSLVWLLFVISWNILGITFPPNSHLKYAWLIRISPLACLLTPQCTSRTVIVYSASKARNIDCCLFLFFFHFFSLALLQHLKQYLVNHGEMKVWGVFSNPKLCEGSKVFPYAQERTVWLGRQDIPIHKIM